MFCCKSNDQFAFHLEYTVHSKPLSLNLTFFNRFQFFLVSFDNHQCFLDRKLGWWLFIKSPLHLLGYLLCFIVYFFATFFTWNRGNSKDFSYFWKKLHPDGWSLCSSKKSILQIYQFWRCFINETKFGLTYNCKLRKWVGTAMDTQELTVLPTTQDSLNQEATDLGDQLVFQGMARALPQVPTTQWTMASWMEAAIEMTDGSMEATAEWAGAGAPATARRDSMEATIDHEWCSVMYISLPKNRYITILLKTSKVFCLALKKQWETLRSI